MSARFARVLVLLATLGIPGELPPPQVAIPRGAEARSVYTPTLYRPLGVDTTPQWVRPTRAAYIVPAQATTNPAPVPAGALEPRAVPVPDPLGAKSIVVALVDPSGNVFYAGAASPADAAAALSATYKAVRPDLVPVVSTSTTSTTTTRTPFALLRGNP